MMRVHRSMRGGGRGTAGGGEWRGHAGGGGWRLLSSALVRGDGSQKNRSSRLAWRGRLAALSVAIECFEALPVRTLVDLIYFPHVGQERSDIVSLSLSLSLSIQTSHQEDIILIGNPECRGRDVSTSPRLHFTMKSRMKSSEVALKIRPRLHSTFLLSLKCLGGNILAKPAKKPANARFQWLQAKKWVRVNEVE